MEKFLQQTLFESFCVSNLADPLNQMLWEFSLQLTSRSQA